MGTNNNSNTRNTLGHQTKSLSLALVQFTLPIYVRFVETGRSHLVEVTEVVQDGAVLTVLTASGQAFTFSWPHLEALEALKDASGRPVFLLDFEDGQDLAQLHHELECNAQSRDATLVSQLNAKVYDYAFGRIPTLPQDSAQKDDGQLEALWHDAFAGAPEYLDLEIS